MVAPSETAQLQDAIALQELALAQHEAAERRWKLRGDTTRADAARWRQRYVRALLTQLRSDLAHLRQEEWPAYTLD